MYTCYCQGGTCKDTTRPMSDGGVADPPVGFADPVTVPIKLSAPVGDGPKARNVIMDVAAIQRGFNALLPGDRGFLTPLAVDGICGPKTKDAIQQFQIKYFGWAGADRLMEPLKQTINKLNELLKDKRYIPYTFQDFARILSWKDPAELAASFERSFALARSWISSGYHRTLNPDVDPLIEKYFRISKQPDKARARAQVATIFGRLNTFFSRPGGLWGEMAFEPEPMLRLGSVYAWCDPGGYFMGGKIGFTPVGKEEILVPTRMDSIYYSLGFMLTPAVTRAYVIVHELCHFVSLRPEIRDTVYAHKDPEGFRNLSPAVRMTNTDNYAMMAYEAATGLGESPVVV